MRSPARSLFLILTVGVLSAPFGAEAQQVSKVYRIGVLNAGSPLPPRHRS